MVGARPNCANNLIGLGRGKNKLDVFRWFFNNFEQRIESGRRDHVRFVNNEDLVPVTCWGKGGAFTQIAGVVHTTVRGRIDFNNIQRTRAAGCQIHTGITGPTRVCGGSLGTVQTAGKNSRRGGFTAAARAREEVSMVDSVFVDRIGQRHGHVFLANNVFKRIRTVAAI